jgi:hypothetical protein
MMYYCRDRRDEEAIRALAAVLAREHWSRTTPLMRHEACFIFGQTGESTLHADR